MNETRHLLALNDDELEELIKKWIARLINIQAEYVGFDRPTASADQGRDSVGFLTEHRYDGAWDNYQCKHLKKPLSLSAFHVELGKMFYYAQRGDFVLPRRYVFVAPNSAVRDVLKLIDRPSKIGPALLAKWDAYCTTGITKSGAPLTPEIRIAIEDYTFDKVMLWKSTDIVEQEQMRGLMVEALGLDPGPAPVLRDIDIPAVPGAEEAGYLGQLLRVYGNHRGRPFADHDEIMADDAYAPRITRARRQFLDRKAFRRHFRDNLDNNLIDQVDLDVLDSVQDRYDGYEGKSPYERLLGVIEHAAMVEVSGPLGKHRRVTPRVKQGACHNHASEGSLQWDR
ncbi:ABC-three component system protein [Granulosicoccus sp. 3-233]|uniref:ABC-three component system protein n=1 Tax=Granulosicoccus sp. 3-233 TaxID=3417969 RepID=UPI003D32EE00